MPASRSDRSVGAVTAAGVLTVGLLAGSAMGALGQSSSPPPAVDYTDAASWITVPSVADKPVDVFYVPPTLARTAPSGRS